MIAALVAGVLLGLVAGAIARAVSEPVARWWAHARGRRYGEGIRTRSGGRFYPLDPRPEEVKIQDVASGIANECRYSGQVRYYSVAEHSVLVSKVVEALAPARVARRWALEALLHDAAEAYLGDMVRPLKHGPGARWYTPLELAVQAVIHRALGIVSTASSRRLIKEVDRRILSDEIVRLFTSPYGGQYGAPVGVVVLGLSPAAAERAWLARYHELAETAA